MVAVNAMLAGDHIPKDQKKILKETKAAFQLDRKVKQFEMTKDGAAFNKAFSNPALGGKLIRDFADSLQEGFKRAGETTSPFANIHPPTDLPRTRTLTDLYPADGIVDEFQMFHAYQDAQTYLPNPIGQEMLRGVASGTTDFDLLKKIAAPKCLDDAGNSPQNPVAQKKMDDKIKMATDKHGGNDCYDFCAGVMVYHDHKSEGIADTLPVDPRPTAKKCDCSALQTCGDGAAMKNAYNAEVKRLRVRRMRQRRRLVQAERRRQLKETPERKLTLRELEADMWFERGVEFLLPAEKVAKSRRKLQARRAKNFFRRNLKKKTRHTARRNRVFTGKKKAGRRNLKQRLALP